MSGLVGKRVVVTRAREQADAMCSALARHGALPVRFPTIAFEPIGGEMEPLETYHWILFTSANGVRFFLERAGADAAAWPRGVRVAAVGPITRAALDECRLPVHAMPEVFQGPELVTALGDVRGSRVLVPRADIGRTDLIDALVAAGARVDDVPVYRTALGQPDQAAFAALRVGVDAVTFTSPSTVRSFLVLLGDEGRAVLANATVAAIGGVTAQAAREEGIRVDVEPSISTTDALVEALARYVEVEA